MQIKWRSPKVKCILLGIVLLGLLTYYRYVLYRPGWGRVLLLTLADTSAFTADLVFSPLFTAAEQGDLKTVKDYIRRGGSPNMAGSRLYGYQTLLHWAGTPEVAEYLISKGGDVHASDTFGQTPLHTASSGDVAQVLLDHGGNLYDVAINGEGGHNEYIPRPITPLHSARSKEIAQVLLARQTDDVCSAPPGHTPSNDYYAQWCELGVTPLHSAKTGEVVEIWVNYGFDPNQKRTDDARPIRGTTPLHDAISGDVAQALLQHGASIDIETDDGFTPLHTARTAGVAQVLVDHGADINAKDNLGRTPLHTLASWEIAYFHTDDARKTAQIFLDNGLDVNSRDDEGRTPLHLAMEIMQEDCLSPPYRAKEYEGTTIPMWGEPCIYNTDLAEFLIDNGADVNAQDQHGHTPLFYALRRSSNTPGASVLIQAGADVNIRDHRDNTPLLWAVDVGERKHIIDALDISPKIDVTFLRLLLDNGADINARNQKQSTALQAIQSLKSNFYGDLKKILEQRGAKE